MGHFLGGIVEGEEAARSSKTPSKIGLVLLQTGGPESGSKDPVSFNAYPITGYEADRSNPNRTKVTIDNRAVFGINSFTLDMPPAQFRQTLDQNNGFIQVDQSGKNAFTLASSLQSGPKPELSILAPQN